MEKGAFIVSGVSRSTANDLVSKFAVGASSVPPPEHTVALKKARIGLYRPWNASIDEGWTRWILENYHYEAKESLQRRYPFGKISAAATTSSFFLT